MGEQNRPGWFRNIAQESPKRLAKANPNRSLHELCAYADLKEVQHCLRDVNERDAVNRTPLHVAASSGRLNPEVIVCKHNPGHNPETPDTPYLQTLDGPFSAVS